MSYATAVIPYALYDNDVIIGESETQCVLRVRDMDPLQKPREKLTQHGAKVLSSPELMAVLLGVGTRKEEVMTMSHRILKEYGERAITYETDPQKLASVLDIPLNKACQIVAGFELGRRYFAQRAGRPLFVRTAQQAHRYFQDMARSQKEQLRGLYLNSHYEVIHDEVISVGSLTANIVHPREVFRPAVAYGAVAVIVAHNHPSGSLDPTQADLDVTRQLTGAGKLLGIDLLDHLIITEDAYKSIMEINNDGTV